MVELSRRQFLKIGAGGLLGLYVGSRFGGFGATPVAEAQIPGGSTRPGGVAKFGTPLLIPPVMPKAGTIKMKGGKNADYYEISMKQFPQQILPAGMPATTVWGYGAVAAAHKKGSAAAQRPIPDHRGQLQHASPRQVDQRTGGRQRQLPAASAGGRSDPALGEPPAGPSGHAPDVHWKRPGPTPARCRSSPTFTALSASVTRATATPRPGSCRTPITSPRASLQRAPGTSSSPDKAMAEPRRSVGPGLRDLRVPEPRPAVDRLVPRPRARA